jgi:hypothetical protein
MMYRTSFLSCPKHDVTCFMRMITLKQHHLGHPMQCDEIPIRIFFIDLCRYVDKNRYQTKKSESIIDLYAFPGSSVYAPLQREGRFPDSRPKGKGIETEHFVPSAVAGLQALEEYLPKRLLKMKIKVRNSPPKSASQQ